MINVSIKGKGKGEKITEETQGVGIIMKNIFCLMMLDGDSGKFLSLLCGWNEWGKGRLVKREGNKY